MQTAEKIYAMLGNENLWQAAAQCHRILAAANISHAVCGGVAVCLRVARYKGSVGLLRYDDA